MTKIEEVRSAMMSALKAGDKPRKEALSLLLSALKNKAIDKQADLSADEENAVVYREIKEAKETLETTPPDRAEIIAQCEQRISVWSEFAPQRMGADEVRALVQQVLTELELSAPTPKDKGRIMKTLMPRLQGKAEGGLVNQIVESYMS